MNQEKIKTDDLEIDGDFAWTCHSRATLRGASSRVWHSRATFEVGNPNREHQRGGMFLGRAKECGLSASENFRIKIFRNNL